MLFLPSPAEMAILSFDSAKVAELADAPDLGSGTERCGGSSPPFRTNRFDTRYLFH